MREHFRFSDSQLEVLLSEYDKVNYCAGKRLKALAKKLGVEKMKISRWFDRKRKQYGETKKRKAADEEEDEEESDEEDDEKLDRKEKTSEKKELRTVLYADTPLSLPYNELVPLDTATRLQSSMHSLASSTQTWTLSSASTSKQFRRPKLMLHNISSIDWVPGQKFPDPIEVYASFGIVGFLEPRCN